jgi:hypothetical protein
MAILFPLRMKRHGLLLEKLAHTVAKKFMVGAEQGSGDHGDTLRQNELES